ncbi:MAG TPA: hypothetical protein VEA78_13140 [Acidimicrobiales bacterium]|nr:hypothetical protein [Acidimicrobiales bacterium]
MTHRLLGRLLLLGGALVVVGSLLPWHAVEGLGTTLNIDGIDSPNNGVVTLIAGVVVAVLGWRMIDAGDHPRRTVLGASVVTAALTAWALLDASNAVDDVRGDVDVALDRLYGQWVLLAGAALVLVVGALNARVATVERVQREIDLREARGDGRAVGSTADAAQG